MLTQEQRDAAFKYKEDLKAKRSLESPEMKEFLEGRDLINQLRDKHEELFKVLFETIGEKRELPKEQWLGKAKYSAYECEIGDLLQGHRRIYKRIK